MKKADFATLVGPALATALEKKGFTELMPVQLAMLDPALAGRDLRVSSQTGSGKTVAIGLAIRELAAGPAPAAAGVARPRALVVVPTRELAKQVDEELRWLFGALGAKVASATGGANVRDERRAFASGPSVVVGTPGRLLDHLNRGGIDPSQLGAVVLDEADRMLDLGFRDELEAILEHAPEGHRTHLVSATFPREVKALADRVQQDPARIEATPLGTANADIDHVVHLVAQHDRVAAIINLLLATRGAQTLVFARTRADVGEITRQLADAGFQVRALSGEMEQHERNQALAAFKRGTLNALVATDVAARGIDVQDIARVVHAEPPTDSDSYTHRSGRTGRAGKKGTSSVLVSPAGLARTSSLLRRTGVRFRVEPIPSAQEIRDASDERLFAALSAETEPSAEDGAEVELDPRLLAIGERLAATGNVGRTIARLLARERRAEPEPRDIRPLEAPIDRPIRPVRAPAPRGDYERAPRHDGPSAPRAARPAEDGWVPFRFTWGSQHGADPRRLLAMACRRGGVRAGDVGAIQVERTHSIVQVASAVAESFARATREPDARDPRVMIHAEDSRASHEAPPQARQAMRPAPSAGPPERAHVPRQRTYEPPPPRVKKEHRGQGAAPRDRPSRAAAATPADRPSRAGAAAPKDRPSRAAAATPKERPSRAAPVDRPSRAGGNAPPKRKH